MILTTHALLLCYKHDSTFFSNVRNWKGRVVGLFFLAEILLDTNSFWYWTTGMESTVCHSVSRSYRLTTISSRAYRTTELQQFTFRIICRDYFRRIDRRRHGLHALLSVFFSQRKYIRSSREIVNIDHSIDIFDQIFRIIRNTARYFKHDSLSYWYVSQLLSSTQNISDIFQIHDVIVVVICSRNYIIEYQSRSIIHVFDTGKMRVENFFLQFDHFVKKNLVRHDAFREIFL